MRRTAFRFSAISCAVLVLVAAVAARTRPRYGDAVRAEVHTTISGYDVAPDLLAGYVFETLVTTDAAGRFVPDLATSWAASNGGTHWEFTLRKGVQFQDGSPLTPNAAAKWLAHTEVPGCKAFATAEGVSFNCDASRSDLPALLSQPKYLIASEAGNNKAFGTGPYRIEKLELNRIQLRANDDYWGGRPYLDALEIAPGKNPRDQITDFALDRADLIEVASDQLRRTQQDHMRTDVSRPSETVYLVINSTKPELRDVRLRQAISLSIDRAAIHNVIFQRQGEVASSLLPNWLTGYAFLFPAAPDLPRAKQMRMEVGNVATIMIGYDIADPLERLIAERVALNVREIGVNMQAVASNTSSADIRLRHVALPSPDGATALNGILDELSIMPAANSQSLEVLYNNERAAVQTYTAIPLVHLPRVTAMKDRIRNWTSSPIGEWKLDDVWVTPRGRP